MALTLAALAALIALTACSSGPQAPNERSMPASGGTAAEFAPQAPPPQDVPRPTPKDNRDVVKTASMRITVDNVSKSADKAAVIVEEADGRVDSRTEDAGSGTGRAETTVVLRVPAAKFDETIRALKELGTVQRAQTSSEDVTAQRVDLDARIKALQTSVDRLLGIMRDAKDPEALIKAEDALSERQAELDSLRAQRETLGERIEYSTVDVTFTAEQVGGLAPNEYEGFVGQIERGWDGLVWVVRNCVLLFGLVLPWLGALVVFAGIVYGAIRLVRARR